MKKTITLLIVVGVLCPFLMMAQQRTITGRVETGHGAPVSAASIQIIGTNLGAIADANGHFVIKASPGDTLLVSSLSYLSKKVVVGESSTVNVLLILNPEMLQETVVTALGVMQQKRSLGYSTTQLPGSDFTKARVPNLGDALSGQVAGVSVAGISTGPGGSSRVIIRGNASLNGNNQPLYVVDGVPYDNSNLGSGGKWGGQDQGDGLAGVNPDDIQSIQVLKSVAASALYGYRGGNGAILITTKSGSHDHGLGVEVNNNYTMDKVVNYHDYQYTYGQGNNGVKPMSKGDANASAEDSWGAKIDGSQAVNLYGNNYSYVAQKDNYDKFYRTGLTNESSIALSGSNTKGNFRLGLGDLVLQGVIPNSNMNQQSVNFNSMYHVTSKLQLNFNVNYSLTNVKNSPGLSDAPGNVNASVDYLANTFDINWLKDSIRHLDGTEYLPGSQDIYFENPYFLANEYLFKTNRQSLTGGVTIKYNILDWLYVQGQVTRNGYIFDYTYVTPSGVQYTISPGNLGGQLTQRETNFHEYNGNVMIGMNKKFGSDFSLDGFVGSNTQDDVSQDFGFGANGPFNIPYFYSPNNITNRPFSYNYSHYRVNSVFGSFTGGYKGYLYLTASARNDWFSTLNINSNRQLYPSFSGSFILSDVLKMPSWVSFAKLRASYAGGSNGTSPYQNALTYGLQGYAINGQSVGYVTNSQIPNQFLKPVSIREKEIGLNVQMFNNRLGLDIDYYMKNTTDDIVPITISPTSGYSGNIANVGRLRNNGIELLLTATPVQSRLFSWDFSFNFADNSSKVLDLGGQQSLVIDGAFPRWGDEANVSNVLGLPYGQIMGFAYTKNDKGQVLVDGNGYPVQSDVVPLGSGVYKYTGGFSNNFKYQDFTFSFLIDFKYGAKIYSGTNILLYANGLQKTTLEGRDGGYVFPGVDAGGSPNKVSVPAETYWQAIATGGQHISQEFVYDASFIKLRSVSITYTFPASLLRDGFIKGASVSLVGRNLAILKKYVPNIDPESNYNNSNGQGLELSGYPTVRNIGVNLNVKF